tara:strand:+ start:132 stop:302 length:171 start_codon:yes stop_codon:yes gene_type:complete
MFKVCTNDEKLLKAHAELQEMYKEMVSVITDKKEKEIILCLIQDLADKLIDNIKGG